MEFAERVYRRVTEQLPGGLAARVDLLRPSARSGWGGPLNGQRERRAIVREIARCFDFDRVIETGTFRGTGTDFFAAVFGVPVSTVEASPRFYHYSRRVLAWNDSVTVIRGDSRAFLSAEGSAARTRTETVFFYLDAHWDEDLPLREELEIIASAWSRAVIMVDDFEVPGDSGYAFDDYGVGKRLTEDYLPHQALDGWALHYPTAPSRQESGARRGCCVLISPALQNDARLATLKLATPRLGF